MLHSDHTIHQRMKDDGAVVFEYEKTMQAKAARLEAIDDNRPWSSQKEMNKGTRDLLEFLPLWGSSFAKIFNVHKPDVLEDELGGECEEIGLPAEGEGLRQQVELAHPEPIRRYFLSHSPSNALLPVAN